MHDEIYLLIDRKKKRNRAMVYNVHLGNFLVPWLQSGRAFGTGNRQVAVSNQTTIDRNSISSDSHPNVT